MITATERHILEEAARKLRAKLDRQQEARAELRALLARLDAFLQAVEDDLYAP